MQSFSGAVTFVPSQTQGNILCCLCGVPIYPNPSNTCVSCIKQQVDITEDIPKQVHITYCGSCGRYLSPPKHWVKALLESKELLTFCIKRIRGLQKVKLIDACFIWTEPHSKRIKVKLTVQKEIFNGAILQQEFVVEFVVDYNMCVDCNRAQTNTDAWKANVQVRQHVEHKRTFFYLEQAIMKYQADEDCINIKDIHEGIDFHFASRSLALKFIAFLENIVSLRKQNAKQLVSHDTKSNIHNFKYTFSVEIAPICRDDLVCLSPKLSQNLGCMGPLVLVYRVTNAVFLVDPFTLQRGVVDSAKYWNMTFRAAMSQKQLVQYIVLDIEPVNYNDQNDQNKGGKFALAEVTVCKENDFDRAYIVRSHLGNLLHPGDLVLGYDTAHANMNDSEVEKLVSKGEQLPDVILVRKSFAEKRKRRRARGQDRNWKLKRLQMEVEESNVKSSKSKVGHMEEDMEMFMQELEEDKELRKMVHLFKDPEKAKQEPGGEQEITMDDGEDDDIPQVPDEELVDLMELLDDMDINE